MRIGSRCEIGEPGTTQKRKRPGLIESWDVRRTALPRSLLKNRVMVWVEHGNGSDGLLWKLVRAGPQTDRKPGQAASGFWACCASRFAADPSIRGARGVAGDFAALYNPRGLQRFPVHGWTASSREPPLVGAGGGEEIPGPWLARRALGARCHWSLPGSHASASLRARWLETDSAESGEESG